VILIELRLIAHSRQITIESRSLHMSWSATGKCNSDNAKQRLLSRW